MAPLALKPATTGQETPPHSVDTAVLVVLIAVGTGLAIPPDEATPMVLVMVDGVEVLKEAESSLQPDAPFASVFIIARSLDPAP